MGLLSLGTPLPWNEAKEFADHVRKHGIEQFLNIYHSQKDRQKQRLLWGDEVSEHYTDIIIKHHFKIMRCFTDRIYCGQV